MSARPRCGEEGRALQCQRARREACSITAQPILYESQRVAARSGEHSQGTAAWKCRLACGRGPISGKRYGRVPCRWRTRRWTLNKCLPISQFASPSFATSNARPGSMKTLHQLSQKERATVGGQSCALQIPAQVCVATREVDGRHKRCHDDRYGAWACRDCGTRGCRRGFAALDLSRDGGGRVFAVPGAAPVTCGRWHPPGHGWTAT